MTTTTKGTLGALVYSLIIGFSFLFLKIALENSNTIDALAHRFLFAYIIIVIIALIKKIFIN
ncbi:hypothetical protein AZF37_01460 [endosymbiont 'TC1' of Trimyema compressum]|nr:hypothetical protein AZF37_01460 [endosymbiont 'TC1' of Trimyema compressum]